MTQHSEKTPPPPGEPDTPRQAEEETAPKIRRLRNGDDVLQSDD